jgi:hypothetical protein
MLRPTLFHSQFKHEEGTHLNGEVSSNGARKRSLWVSLAKHHSAALDRVETFPDHGDDWAGHHVVDEILEEWLLGKIGIMLLEVSTSGCAHLESHHLEASLLESLQKQSRKFALLNYPHPVKLL